MKSLLLLACLPGLCISTLAGTADIHIDAARPGPAINPRLYGIFLEEINHSVDGGLYAELIANRAFEDSRPPEGCAPTDGRWKSPHGWDSGFTVAPGTVPRWSLLPNAGGGTMQLETSGGLNDASPYCLRIDPPQHGVTTIANEGYWGINIRPGAAYDLLLHARGAGRLQVRLEDAAGHPVSDTVTLDGIGPTWQPFQATLHGTRAATKARLVIRTAARGPVWLDFVSLLPRDTWKGRGLRPDLAQMIADLKPGFVRFPGGCVIEGGNHDTAYDWKLSIGPVTSRPERWSAWNHRRTHSMGFLETLQFCEDIGAAPLWVSFAGQSCIFREASLVPLPEMPRVVDNFLDAIEFANGSADSTWGRKRAAAGRSKPFSLKLVEIGNENATVDFPPRYQMIQQAIKARHPDITCIADLSWISRDLMKDSAFDIEDNHIYSSAQWFLANQHLYDERDRKLPPLYLGEVAVTSVDGGDLKGNLRAALAEGAFMMGCERNGDVVRMISYAPLISHVNRTHGWHGMIYHDSSRAFGTVSYYLWKLFSANRPDHTVHTRVTSSSKTATPISGSIGVGTWETAAEFRDIQVRKGGHPLAGAWTEEGGRWTNQEGVRRQSDQATGMSWFGSEDWSNYTLTLQARKISGSEGFLVAFGRRDGEKYWWNIGGWGNREHGIEFNQSPVGPHQPGTIETGRWYDIRIELAGRRIRCFLDGKLIHDATALESEHLIASTGFDAVTGEWVLKAINTSSESMTTRIHLEGGEKSAATGQCTVLQSARPTDNNSLEEPLRVVPVTSPFAMAGSTFDRAFPPYSLTILRWKAR